MYKVFIDGREGTTGLRIFDRLAGMSDIEMLVLGDELRKNPDARREMINKSDITFLCLPDAAARESVELAQGSNARIIDTSTAHRTADGWAYGFPELSADHRQGITEGKHVAVPGCHASGFVALVYPLVACGVLPADYPLSCFSITGYSGGGKSMIADYKAEGRSIELDSPRQYGLSQQHKHLKEMKVITGIDREPIFSPIVADYYSGMEVTVPIYPSLLNKKLSGSQLRELYAGHYSDSKLISVSEYTGSNGFLAANALSGKDSMLISVEGNDDRISLVARFDNLGKGASGAAIQCLNLMLSLDETSTLCL